MKFLCWFLHKPSTWLLLTYQEAHLDNDCKFGTTFVRQKTSQDFSAMPFGLMYNWSNLQINEACLTKINFWNTCCLFIWSHTSSVCFRKAYEGLNLRKLPRKINFPGEQVPVAVMTGNAQLWDAGAQHWVGGTNQLHFFTHLHVQKIQCWKHFFTWMWA